MKAAGEVPRKGFTHEACGITFEVLQTDATHILEIAVRRVPETDPTDPASPPAGEEIVAA
jgi:Mg2+/Co2+ transporter CorC